VLVYYKQIPSSHEKQTCFCHDIAAQSPYTVVPNSHKEIGGKKHLYSFVLFVSVFVDNNDTKLEFYYEHMNEILS